MEFADSSRVGGEREVCTNRCVIVGSLWAERERERGRGKGKGRGRGTRTDREGEWEEEMGGDVEAGTVGIRWQFMFSF